jgi:SAM-dependent methyltransferase
LIAEQVIGKEILDIGYACQPNPYLSNFTVVGFDLIERIDFNTDYSEYVQGDAKDLLPTLEGRLFDTIICGEFIEHLENPYKFLRDCRKLLQNNGLLILSTPNPAGFPMFFAELLQINRFFFGPYHTFAFLPRWVQRMIESSGFIMVKNIGVGLWCPWGYFPWTPIILSYQIIYVAKIG